MKLNFKIKRNILIPTGIGMAKHSLFLVFTLITFSVSGQTLNDKLFVEAMKHVENQQWLKAEGILEFQLTQNEDWHRARVELALVYTKQGKHTDAISQLDKVLAIENLPLTVRTNLEKVRQDIVQTKHQLEQQSTSVTKKKHINELEKPGVHSVNSYLEVALGYDDNVRFSSGDYFLNDDPYLDGTFIEHDDGTVVYVAPDGFVYDIDGNPLFKNNGLYDFGDSNKSTSFTESYLHVNHLYQSNQGNDFKWRNSLFLQANENSKFSDFNKFQVKLNTELSWQLSERYKISVQADHRLLKRDNQIQVRSSGVNPYLTYYSKWGAFEFGYEWLVRKYEDATFNQGDFVSVFDGFKSKTHKVSIKWSKLFWHNKLLLLGKANYFSTNASDEYDYTGKRFTVAAVYNMNDNWKWSFSASDFELDYRPPDQEFGNPKDHSQSFKTKLSYDVNQNVELFVSAERALRISEVYGGISSDKTLGKLGVRFKF
jgi:hypothetical protein